MRILGLGLSHDASAVIIEDDELSAAVEEERLNRLKHSDCFPINAIRACLDATSSSLADVDVIAIAGNESFLDQQLLNRLNQFRHPLRDRLNPIPRPAPEYARFDSFATYVRAMLERQLEQPFRGRIAFFDHHLSHAFSAYGMSPCDDSLAVALDGAGDGIAGAAFSVRNGDVEILSAISIPNSLGKLYEQVITTLLGYHLFDEYKVMGLAPYGDPATFREAFVHNIELHPNGDFSIHREDICQALIERVSPRLPGSEFSKVYQDIAAALQETVESIGLHFFRHLQEATGHRNLCFAGGFAHNCSFTGKLLYSGIFEHIHVAPAADDAGLALGAAALAAMEKGVWSTRRRNTVFLGPAVSDAKTLDTLLEAWDSCISFERTADIARQTASLLAQGSVVAWVQGRCEFGPRALGNRCILADPRPAENKSRINAMIKKREAYRPFAPSVLLERAGDFFDLPAGQEEFPSMSIVLRVRSDKRTLLGAVTHVDGSARVQTVRKRDNPRYWELISEIGKLTDVPIVLNTSFNNHREPIVTSSHDALTCFLTTDLDYLVIDDVVIRKKGPQRGWLREMYIARQHGISLRRDDDGFWSESAHHSLKTQSITRAMFGLLLDADGSRTISDLASAAGIAGISDIDSLVDDVFQLWSERHIIVAPRAIAAPLSWAPSFDKQWAFVAD